MRMTTFIPLTLLVGILPAALGQAAGPHRASPLLAAQITGTYKAGNRGTLDVQALSGGRVRFRFVGLADLRAPGGPNIGDAAGTLPLRYNTAIYYDKDDGGRMRLRFAPGRVVITQTGDLGFGMGVIAEGVYEKVSSKSPKFDPKD